MIRNQKGGIICKLVMMPVAVMVIVGVFYIGFTLGKHHGKSGIPDEVMPPLPEMASSNGTKPEEFTFYKTLTDKTDQTVSIDLKPKPANEEIKPEKRPQASEAPKTMPDSSAQKEKRTEIKTKEAALPAQPKRESSKQPQPSVNKGSAAAASRGKLRYTLQTAAYPEKGMAEGEVKRLKKRGYAAFVFSSELRGKGMWHRVRLGSFSNRAAAEKLQKTLHAKEGISAFIAIE